MLPLSLLLEHPACMLQQSDLASCIGAYNVQCAYLGRHAGCMVLVLGQSLLGLLRRLLGSLPGSQGLLAQCLLCTAGLLPGLRQILVQVLTAPSQVLC